MKSKKQLLYTCLTLFVSAFAFLACSKDEDPQTGNNKKAKITFSVSEEFSKAEGDDFSLGAGAAAVTGSSTKYVDWKVDGETEIGTVVSVGSGYVDGGKSNIVVESVQGFASGSVTISSFNIGGAPFTVTYKVEVDGKIIDEQSVVINDGDDPLYKNYTF